MEHGQIAVLLQPAELVIIAGAALGTLLIANPLSTLTRIFKGVILVLKGSPYNKAFYLDTLKMLNELFTRARKEGMPRLEEDIEDPPKSPVFKKYPNSWRITMWWISCAIPCAWPSAAALPPSIWIK